MVIYLAKLKSRKQMDADIPRKLHGWWADICPGKTLRLREATEQDLARCTLNAEASRDPADYLCELPERGSLVSRAAVAQLLVDATELASLRARIAELEAKSGKRTTKQADAG